jgi:cyclase
MSPLRLLPIIVTIAIGLLGAACRAAEPRGDNVVGETTGRWTEAPVEPIVEIAPRLYLIAGGGCNTIAFVTARGVVVVDTKYAVRWADTLAAIRTVTDKPITHVINTHFHGDHAEGNRRLDPTATIVAHERTAAFLRELSFLPATNSGATPVTELADRLTLFDGEDAVDLYHLGPAHTSGDTVVVFRQARVMAVGDVFPNKEFPIINIEGGGSARTFASELHRVATTITGVDRIVTGHGPVLPWASLAEHAEFMRFVTEHVRTEMRFLRKKNDVFNALRLPERFKEYSQERSFNTQDEIDRSFRPRWQRVFSLASAWTRLDLESPRAIH